MTAATGPGPDEQARSDDDRARALAEQLAIRDRELAEVRAALGRAWEELREDRRAAAALRASEARYRALIENLEQNVFLKDRDFRFVAANRPFCQALGRAEADILARTDFDLYPPALAAKYRAADTRVLAEGKRLEAEEESLVDGRPCVVRVVKTPVKDEQGRAVGVLGIFWDVTEQRTREAQRWQAQKIEAVGQLAGGVAHDFNNLLTVILGNAALVLSRLGPDDPHRALLVAVERAGTRAAQLTRQLLDFSRRAPLRAEPVALGLCIQEAVHLLGRAIDPRIRVEVETPPDLWPVLADPALTGQALLNLCLNARDAMPEGGLLRLRTENVELGPEEARGHREGRAGRFVRLSVEDSGGGIPPDVARHLFEPLVPSGGLGLAMVYGIVKQHQGWIDCHSAAGRGTRFDVYLPCREQAVEPPRAPGPR